MVIKANDRDPALLPARKAGLTAPREDWEFNIVLKQLYPKYQSTLKSLKSNFIA